MLSCSAPAFPHQLGFLPAGRLLSTWLKDWQFCTKRHVNQARFTGFKEKFGKLPDYSVLLDELAKTRTERQQLLRPYFEANEQEREEGLKQPTAAHHAIAQLAAQGFIKVIITTNFDSLTESALREAGIQPAVLSSPDDLKGALPLPHMQCCVFKVHGDYLDTRIRNTLLTNLTNIHAKSITFWTGCSMNSALSYAAGLQLGTAHCGTRYAAFLPAASLPFGRCIGNSEMKLNG